MHTSEIRATLSLGGTMRQPAAALTVAMLCAVSAPSSLVAQQAWKPIIVGSKPERAVQWSMAVDTQGVVREADGKYAVLLRWRAASDSLSAPRVDRIERHHLNCPARQTTYRAMTIVPAQEGKEALLVHFTDSEMTSIGFPSEGPEREFFEGVCLWAQKAVPGS
jgi:hypothetical protein